MNKQEEPIGGFFELEITSGNNFYHKNALALTNGRACMHLIVKKIESNKIYVPYYTCNALFDPLIINNIPYEFYSINENLEPLNLPHLKEQEYFLYVNYFGMKNKTVKYLIDTYHDNLILDNTHDFFHSQGYDKIWFFTSARKYFGVPDGAYLYSPKEVTDRYERFTDISINHSVNRLIGKQELSYNQFLKYEESLNSEIKSISKLSEKLLSNVDYEKVKNIRKENFEFFMGHLEEFNQLHIDYNADLTPFCYPFLPNFYIDKNIFYKNKYYIPSYWLDTTERGIEGFETEKYLSRNLLPLPIDHRYNKDDLKGLLILLLKILNG